MRNIKIAMVLYTLGLDYDDRIRKEILSICSLFKFVSFKIFCITLENKEFEGITSYGIPFKNIFLKSREKYSSGTNKIKKAIELYNSIKDELDNYDYIWCVDVETFYIVLKTSKPIIWDLHELPMIFCKNYWMRLFFRYLVNRCKVVIHANMERIEFLVKQKMIPQNNHHFYLRNYPNFNEFLNEKDKQLSDFILWKNNRKCVYLQGLNSESRAAYESMKAILECDDLCAVVVGNIEKNSKEKLIREYGDISHKIYFTGMIKQLMTPMYIKECILSLIFYKNSTPNNYYCEANRLYQNIVNGNPVIVGNNPTMKEIVEKYGFGISINSDGSDLNEIIDSIKKILLNYSLYKMNVIKNRSILNWESQNDTIKRIIETLLE